MSEAAAPGPPHVFADFGYRCYFTARLTSVVSMEMITVSVGWQIYDTTRNPLDLGLIGLFYFLPALLLILVTGWAADHLNRRRVMAASLSAMAAAALGLLALTASGNRETWPIFALIAALGTARAFINPAMRALISNIVAPERLVQAIAANSTATNVGTITGPVLGGLIYGLAAEAAFGVTAVVLATGAVAAILIPNPPRRPPPAGSRWEVLIGGFRYLRVNRLLLGLISLDLFAVLLGGAVALLPVYARDILHAGPVALGVLRASTAVGAILVGAWLTWRPIGSGAGRLMLLAVAGFGAAMLVFGLSKWVWLSAFALAVSGGCDMVSVMIRETLIQLTTPDEMRGRVNAIYGVFIGASNELGQLRAGTMAALIGAVPAVAVGGLAAIGVAALWSRWFPEILRADRVDGSEQAASAQPRPKA